MLVLQKLEAGEGSIPALQARAQELHDEMQRVADVRMKILNGALEYSPRCIPVSSQKRVVLGDDMPCPPPRCRFKRAMVMGLYHSCTNAVAQELEKRFVVEVVNDWHTSKADVNWKHRVNTEALVDLAEDCLVVLMVKEPLFWLKSCSRELRNFFEIHPFKENDKGEREDVPATTLQQLFGPIEHDAVLYGDAVGLWNDTVRSYFDDAIYPPDQAVVVRCEDFLFSFHKVMDGLAAYGLHERCRQGGACPPEPLRDRAKGHAECRTRDEALRFYRDGANRCSDFTRWELALVADELDVTALRRLRYDGTDPTATWVVNASAGR